MSTYKKKIFNFVSKTEEETKKFAVSFIKKILKKKQKIIAFSGELGSGKTHFIKGMLSFFPIIKENDITSPTFSYLHIYPTQPITYHFDLYRIPDKNLFLEMGFDEFFEKEGICLIEWSERISSILPKDTIKVSMTILGKTTRRIEIYE